MFGQRIHKLHTFLYQIHLNTSKEKRNTVVWDIDDSSKFIHYYKDDIDNRTVFLFLFTTGIGKEELLGLEKYDFNFEDNSVKIRRTYQYVGGKEFLSSKMKTENSNRTL